MIIIIMIKIIIIQNTALLGTACILITILLKMVVVCCLLQLPINFDQSDCTLSFKVTPLEQMINYTLTVHTPVIVFQCTLHPC